MFSPTYKYYSYLWNYLFPLLVLDINFAEYIFSYFSTNHTVIFLFKIVHKCFKHVDYI